MVLSLSLSLSCLPLFCIFLFFSLKENTTNNATVCPCALLQTSLCTAFISGICASKKELLALMVKVFWILINVARITLLKGLCSFNQLYMWLCDCHSSTSLPALEVISPSIMPQMGEGWCQMVALIYLFLIISGIEPTFIGLMASSSQLACCCSCVLPNFKLGCLSSFLLEPFSY